VGLGLCLYNADKEKNGDGKGDCKEGGGDRGRYERVVGKCVFSFFYKPEQTVLCLLVQRTYKG
jgi:hypothetical protein